MRQLIEDYVPLAATQRAAPKIVQANGQRTADGGWALYLAAQRLKDERWQYQASSRLARFYANLGWKTSDAEIHLVASETDHFFGAIGPNQALYLPNRHCQALSSGVRTESCI